MNMTGTGTTHELYMRRALQLAANGRGFTSPNPMVGCVIVAHDRIIGEGYHRRCGGPHAEVWAMRSVSSASRTLLPDATVYVTLEPCSHFGKTPPCADMLVESGVGSVVIGCTDPNPKVAGRGIERLRKAGINVKVGVLEQDCIELNRPFMARLLMHRPYILLKWAQSADGYMDSDRKQDEPPCAFSTSVSRLLMHRLRAGFDAIMVGAGTIFADNPTLTVRDIAGRQPRPVVVDRRGRVPAEAKVFSTPGAIYLSASVRMDLPASVTQVVVPAHASACDLVKVMKDLDISSVMVEGGAELLNSFISTSLWDDARVEVAPFALAEHGAASIAMPAGVFMPPAKIGRNSIINVKNPAPSSF